MEKRKHASWHDGKPLPSINIEEKKVKRKEKKTERVVVRKKSLFIFRFKEISEKTARVSFINNCSVIRELLS